LVVALDLVYDAAGCASHRAGPSANHRSDWSAHHRSGSGTDCRAGALLSGGAGPGQETQGCNERELLHRSPPCGLSDDHWDNSARTGQFEGRTGTSVIGRVPPQARRIGVAMSPRGVVHGAGQDISEPLAPLLLNLDQQDQE
jgi:hypothetical protein